MTKFDFDEALVRRLSELLEETGLTEIEYEAEGHRIRVAREAQVVLAAPSNAPQVESQAHPKAEGPAAD